MQEKHVSWSRHPEEVASTSRTGTPSECHGRADQTQYQPTVVLVGTCEPGRLPIAKIFSPTWSF